MKFWELLSESDADAPLSSPAAGGNESTSTPSSSSSVAAAGHRNSTGSASSTGTFHSASTSIYHDTTSDGDDAATNDDVDNGMEQQPHNGRDDRSSDGDAAARSARSARLLAFEQSPKLVRIGHLKNRYKGKEMRRKCKEGKSSEVQGVNHMTRAHTNSRSPSQSKAVSGISSRNSRRNGGRSDHSNTTSIDNNSNNKNSNSVPHSKRGYRSPSKPSAPSSNNTRYSKKPKWDARPKSSPGPGKPASADKSAKEKRKTGNHRAKPPVPGSNSNRDNTAPTAKTTTAVLAKSPPKNHPPQQQRKRNRRAKPPVPGLNSNRDNTAPTAKTTTTGTTSVLAKSPPKNHPPQQERRPSVSPSSRSPKTKKPRRTKSKKRTPNSGRSLDTIDEEDVSSSSPAKGTKKNRKSSTTKRRRNGKGTQRPQSNELTSIRSRLLFDGNNGTEKRPATTTKGNGKRSTSKKGKKESGQLTPQSKNGTEKRPATTTKGNGKRSKPKKGEKESRQLTPQSKNGTEKRPATTTKGNGKRSTPKKGEKESGQLTPQSKNGKGKGKNTAFHVSQPKSTPKKKKQQGDKDSAVLGGSIDPNDGADDTTEKRPATATKGNDNIATKLDTTPPGNQPPTEDSGTNVGNEASDIVTFTTTATRKSHTARAGEQPTSKDRTCSGIAPSSASNTAAIQKSDTASDEGQCPTEDNSNIASDTTTTEKQLVPAILGPAGCNDPKSDERNGIETNRDEKRNKSPKGRKGGRSVSPKRGGRGGGRSKSPKKTVSTEVTTLQRNAFPSDAIFHTAATAAAAAETNDDGMASGLRSSFSSVVAKAPFVAVPRRLHQHCTILAGNSRSPSLRSDMDIDNKGVASALQKNGEENNTCKLPAKKLSQNTTRRGLHDKTNNGDIASSVGSEKHSSENNLATTADSTSSKSSCSRKTTEHDPSTDDTLINARTPDASSSGMIFTRHEVPNTTVTNLNDFDITNRDTTISGRKKDLYSNHYDHDPGDNKGMGGLEDTENGYHEHANYDEDGIGGFDDDGGDDDDENHDKVEGNNNNNNTNTPASGDTDRKIEGNNNTINTTALGDTRSSAAPTTAVVAAVGEVSAVDTVSVGTVSNTDAPLLSAVTQTTMNPERTNKDTNSNGNTDHPTPLVTTYLRDPSTDNVDPHEGKKNNNNNHNKTDTPPSVANRSQFSPIDTMEEPEEFSRTTMAAVTTTAVGEETAVAAPLSVAETGNEEAPPPAAVDPSITMTTWTTMKTTEKEEEAKGSRNAAPPRVEQEIATAQQEQPSAVLPEEKKEEGSAPSSSQPQPQQQQGKLVGEAADLAATTAPAATVTSTTTTMLSGAATIVPPVVTVRPSVGTHQGSNNNTTNPSPSSATNLQVPSSITVDPTIVPPVVTVCPSVGTNQGNNNNTTNPPSSSAMSDTGSSGGNRNGENTNEKVHAGSNLESVETIEEQDQEQDDAFEEEEEDDDESIPVNNDEDGELSINSGSDEGTETILFLIESFKETILPEMKISLPAICGFLIKSFKVGNFCVCTKGTKGILHNVDEDDHAKLAFYFGELVRHIHKPIDDQVFPKIIDLLLPMGVVSNRGIVHSIFNTIRSASFTDKHADNEVKALAYHPKLEKSKSFQIVDNFDDWDSDKPNAIYIPSQFVFTSSWCDNINDKNEKFFQVESMLLRKPNDKFISIVKTKWGKDNYQVLGEEEKVLSYSKLKSRFEDSGCTLFLASFKSDTKFLTQRANLSGGYRPFRGAESPFGKSDPNADHRFCVADVVTCLFRLLGIKDENGDEYPYEIARGAIPQIEIGNNNEIGNNVSISAAKDFLRDNGFNTQKKLKPGPLRKLFTKVDGQFFVLVSYRDKMASSTPDDNRHVFLFCAERRYVADAFGGMKFREDERQNPDTMKNMIKDFLGGDVKYTIENAWKVYKKPIQNETNL